MSATRQTRFFYYNFWLSLAKRINQLNTRDQNYSLSVCVLSPGGWNLNRIYFTLFFCCCCYQTRSLNQEVYFLVHLPGAVEDAGVGIDYAKQQSDAGISLRGDSSWDLDIYHAHCPRTRTYQRGGGFDNWRQKSPVIGFVFTFTWNRTRVISRGR